MQDMKEYRKLNFSSGPAQLPMEVLEEIRDDLINYKGSGMSIMEMSHRYSWYSDVHQEVIQRLKTLLDINEDKYEVILMQGGARAQFSMVPLNIANRRRKGAYILSGVWSEEAYNEALALDSGYILAGEIGNYEGIPDYNLEDIRKDTSYIHFTSNNTISGTQYKNFPKTDLPIVADMTSDLLSKKVNVDNFGLIYAAAQKNAGIAGVTIVIINKELLNKKNNLPASLNYFEHIKNSSMLSTPPTFSIYVLNLMTKWIENMGGLNTIEKINLQKAKLIYDYIDNSSLFYTGLAAQNDRSTMNITFKLPTKELEKLFLDEAEKMNIIGVNGHYLLGGCRVSNYNGITKDDINKMVLFMKEFKEINSDKR